MFGTRRVAVQLALMCAGLAAIEQTSRAATYYVATNGNDVAAGTNWATARCTIQAAVDLTVGGDVVLVSNGVYSSGGRTVANWAITNRVAVTNAIGVRSVSGPDCTFIVGASNPAAIRCVYLGSNATLSGFTITNGWASSTGDSVNERSGGGALCVPSAVISNCLLIGNTALGYVGGGCYGGTLNNCRLVGNSSAGGGAGFSTLNNCLIAGNSGKNKAAAYICTLNNCTVTGNTNGLGVDRCTLRNSIIYGNPNGSGSGASFYTNCCGDSLLPGPGNVLGPPCFRATNDYRLVLPSPCIDAGNTEYSSFDMDLDGRVRVTGRSVDMGCYEYAPGITTGGLTVAISMTGTSAPPPQICVYRAQISGDPMVVLWQFDDGRVITNALVTTNTYLSCGYHPVILMATNVDSSVCSTSTIRIIPSMVSWASTASTAWDLTSTNWQSVPPVAGGNFYVDGAWVRFDDTTPGVQTNVVIDGAALPGGIVVDASAYDYAIHGYLAGTGGLTKLGSGVLWLHGSNDMSGGIRISNGTIRIGEVDRSTSYVLGAPGSSIAIDGGALDLCSIGLVSNEMKRLFNWGSFTLAGHGPDGQGAIVNNGDCGAGTGMIGLGNSYTHPITLVADASIGGRQRWDMTGYFDLAGHTLTKRGTNTIYMNGGRIGGGAVVVSEGQFGLAWTAEAKTGSITVLPGASLWLWELCAGDLAAPISLDRATITQQPYDNRGGDCIVSSPITISNMAYFGFCMDRGALMCCGAISGDGALIKIGDGRVSLLQSNSYSGLTIVSNGTLCVLGSIGTGGVSVARDAKLMGTGRIDGYVESHGTVVPGELASQPYFNDTTGTLTILNDIELSPEGSFAINLMSATNYSSLYVAGAAHLAGTLMVWPTNSYQPAKGDCFEVLKAGNIAGFFSATNLPSLTPHLGWQVNYSPTNVTLVVTGVQLTGYALWASAITNGMIGPTDCSTSDGNPNLLKYAMGCSPTSDASAVILGLPTTNGLYALQFPRNTNAHDIWLIAEGSPAINTETNWLGFATNIGGSWGDAINVYETGTGTPAIVTVEDPQVLTSNRFFRLRVIMP